MTMKRKSWQDYQKEIADDHYYYARSCIRQNFFPGSEKLFIDMLRNDLGKDLSDDPKHSSHGDRLPFGHRAAGDDYDRRGAAVRADGRGGV